MLSEAARKCSECGASLAGRSPTTKTCSPKCRATRSRRQRDANKAAHRKQELTAAAQDLKDRVDGVKDDELHKIVNEELTPVVRESITEETLRAIQQMVGLTPEAVVALQADLRSENDVIRQRAYSLILKYTVGNPAITHPDNEDKTRPLQIHFGLPRPDIESISASSVEIPEPDSPTKQCDKCGEDKPFSEFIANSDRCQTCYEAGRLRAQEILDT